MSITSELLMDIQNTNYTCKFELNFNVNYNCQLFNMLCFVFRRIDFSRRKFSVSKWDETNQGNPHASTTMISINSDQAMCSKMPIFNFHGPVTINNYLHSNWLTNPGFRIKTFSDIYCSYPEIYTMSISYKNKGISKQEWFTL